MAKTKPKYADYQQLADAFKSGELSREDYILRMDNDNCNLRYIGDQMDEDEAYGHCQSLFRGEGYGDIVEVCNVAGIPCEWV